MALPTTPEAWLELHDGQTYWLKDQCKIGRRKGINDLVLDVPLLSREHAQIDATPHGFRLTDVGSSNGTMVNQHPLVRPTILKDGDTITLGNVAIRFRSARPPLPNDSEDDYMLTTKKLGALRTADCWLLITDVEGYSATIEQLGSQAALQQLQKWITDLRPCIEHNGGIINSYVGDAIFAYWRTDLATPAQVITALRELDAQRSLSPLAYRIVVHHGSVLFTQSERGEELSGQDVNFAFRSEKIGKRLHNHTLLSQKAVESLELEGHCAPSGTSPVEGIPGLFAFFTPNAEVLRPDSKTGCRLLLVEESSVLSDGLAHLLENEAGMKVCDRAQHGPTVRRLCAKHQPDVVIIDLAVRSTETLALIQDIVQESTSSHILILTGLSDVNFVERALRAGALGYVLKTDPTSQVIEAIKTVAQGGMFLSRQIAVPALRQLTGGAAERMGVKQGPGALSDRELDVFRLIGLGQPNREIAMALGISVKTVETHRENIKLKLKLGSAAELATLARQWAEGRRE
ncbi:MAG TPA: FHA domain-containing protein [Opitutaceae bacterium]|nr:MAG: Oxygen regulatory protein NreC [Betaproteobacteria bacterium ADurb.Bin341]HOY53393.1 FHA domain-containing protein [Opitutaceae bacterium]HOY53398.1 FHA domain-containing protein [Opitutaceae bacterium]HPO00278.1 FHA domain-containing protein [Opitutaceae bacterium]